MAELAQGPFRALQHRDFRLFWIGFIVSNSGAWIQSVAQAWLVYELSGSAVWLGAVGLMRALPLVLLALVGGTVADRLPKKRILYLTQSVMLMVSLMLGGLTYLGIVQVWHVMLLTVISAVAQAFDQPTRQSLIPTLVSKVELHSALSLNAIAFNGAAAFGPSLAGLLVPAVGLAGCFFINGLSFAAVFVALWQMKFPPHPVTGRKPKSMAVELVEGLKFVAKTPLILAIISMAAVNSFFARPFQQFLTVFAADIFHGDIGMVGLMQTALAVGTIIFMLAVASLGDIHWKGKLLIASGFGFSVFLIAFAWAPNIYASLLLLVLVGGFNMTWMTTATTLVHLIVEDSMRGRVIAAFTVSGLAMMPLGQGPMGWTVEQFGPRWALTLGGGISLIWIAYMGLIRVKAVRTLS